MQESILIAIRNLFKRGSWINGLAVRSTSPPKPWATVGAWFCCADKRTYRDLLTNSLEGIATNVLGSRLKTLVAKGFLTAQADPDHRQRTIYSLTEKAIALLPAMIALGAWGRQFLPVTAEYAIRDKILEEGGPEIQEAFYG